MITFFVLVFIDVWRAQFKASSQRLLDNDDEDDVVLNFVLELGFVNLEEILPSIRGGSRPRKSHNIERFRVEMHCRMIFDYFCDERSMCQICSVDTIARNIHFF